MADDIVTCDACPVLCRIRPGKTGACDRYGNVDGAARRASIRSWSRSAPRPDGSRAVPGGSRTGTADPLSGAASFVTGIGAGTTYPDYKPAPFIVVERDRRRRHGHGRDRGHLQLLRLQGEDRHRPLSRPRAGAGALQGRAGRPRDDGRVRLADALARRRAPPDRRQQEGRRRHLRDDAGAVQQGARSSSRSTAARRSSCGRARRRSSTACARSACASAAARRRSASSPSNGTAMSTR